MGTRRKRHSSAGVPRCAPVPGPTPGPARARPGRQGDISLHPGAATRRTGAYRGGTFTRKSDAAWTRFRVGSFGTRRAGQNTWPKGLVKEFLKSSSCPALCPSRCGALPDVMKSC